MIEQLETFFQGKVRIVDLSHELNPGQEEYPLSVETAMLDEVYPQYKRRPDIWYTMQTLHANAHVGTHIEFPRHFNPEGMDAASFPIELLAGPACVLDFRAWQDNAPITLADVQAQAEWIKARDVVLLHTGRSAFYRTPQGHNRPYLSPEAAIWLADEMQVRVFGVDATGIDLKDTDHHPLHTLLLKERSCAIIECIAHLECLQQRRCILLIPPLRVNGLDSSPVRLIAIEDLSDAS